MLMFSSRQQKKRSLECLLFDVIWGIPFGGSHLVGRMNKSEKFFIPVMIRGDACWFAFSQISDIDLINHSINFNLHNNCLPECCRKFASLQSRPTRIFSSQIKRKWNFLSGCYGEWKANNLFVDGKFMRVESLHRKLISQTNSRKTLGRWDWEVVMKTLEWGK